MLHKFFTKSARSKFLQIICFCFEKKNFKGAAARAAFRPASPQWTSPPPCSLTRPAACGMEPAGRRIFIRYLYIHYIFICIRHRPVQISHINFKVNPGKRCLGWCHIRRKAHLRCRWAPIRSNHLHFEDIFCSWLQCMPLYTILLAMGNPTVHFFSLDVEGAEFPVLKTIPWDKVLFLKQGAVFKTRCCF